MELWRTNRKPKNMAKGDMTPDKSPDMKMKGDVDSGTYRENYVKTLGGYPPEKKIDEIFKENMPRSTGTPPGSVRV